MYRPYNLRKNQQSLNDWLTHSPENEFARFAQLRFNYDEAWIYRGGNYSKDTAKENFDIFYASLEDALNAANNPKSALYGTAISANLQLGIALDLEGLSQNTVEIYRDSATKWPNHSKFHHIIINRLVPRWGGSWSLVESAISSISDQSHREYGDLMYSKLYYQVHSHFKVNPEETAVEWPRLKSSLEEWIEFSPGHKAGIVAASYACLYGDGEMYENHRPSSEGKYQIMNPITWLKSTNWEICESRRDNDFAELDELVF